MTEKPESRMPACIILGLMVIGCAAILVGLVVSILGAS